jgi:two-component system nitrate/nitrite sensor histidine kinase NarX
MLASIRAKLGTLFASFMLLVAGSVIATALAISTQATDALVINLAGRQRMLTQRITKAVLGIAQDPDSGYRAELQETIYLFDHTLTALENGGPVLYGEDTVTLPPTTNASASAQLDTVSGLWIRFHEHVETVLTATPGSTDLQLAVREVESLSLVILQEMDQAVRLYEAAARVKVARLRTIQLTFFITAAGLLVTGHLTTQWTIVTPLSRLRDATRRITGGDLQTTVETTPGASAEIQSLARSFEEMRRKLSTSQQALAQKAGELETAVEQRTRQLEALLEINVEISSRLEIGYVLDSIVAKTRDLTGGEVAVLCLSDESNDYLTVAATDGMDDALLGCSQIALEDMTDHHIDPTNLHIDCDCPLLQPEFRRSHLAVPLRLGDRTLGVLCVGHRERARFSEQDARLLTLLSNASTIALENARSYQEAERAATLTERERILVEVHDGLAQTLNYLTLRLDIVEELIADQEMAEVPEHLALTGRTVEKASQEVRRLMSGLHASADVDATLETSLQQAIQDFGKEHQIEIDFQAEVKAPVSEPPQVHEQVKRVVLEALTNVYRHAEASRATVTLAQRDKQLIVRVQDSGPGFDPNAPTDGGHHFGLRVMATRAEWIGGELGVESALGQGTTITLSWPAAEASEAQGKGGRA